MTPSPDLNALPLPQLYSALSSSGTIDALLRIARDEDLGDAGDITTTACFDEASRNQPVQAGIIARRDCIAAGLATLDDLNRVFGSGVDIEAHIEDGHPVRSGACMAHLTGPRQTILTMERTALNLIGRLSGIATLTRKFVDRVRAEAPGSATRILDTRKTTPGLRLLEKYAVRCGGGWSHRIGLHDAILIKDNHIAGIPPQQFGEFVRQAAARARGARMPNFVEVEVDNLDQLKALLALEKGVVDIILLDNMDPATVEKAVRMRDASSSRPLLEASGGITIENIGEMARTGIDRISIGALTHQATSIDCALDFPS